jgi:hypothetical protein
VFAILSIALVLTTLLTNSYYLVYLFPYGQAKPYHDRYLQFVQIAVQNNAVVVSVNARLVWVMSQFKLDFIDLAELANEMNIDNASAAVLINSIRNYLQSGRTVMYLVTEFEIGHASEYGNFENDFSFFLLQLMRAFNSTQMSGTPVPPPEYVLLLS